MQPAVEDLPGDGITVVLQPTKRPKLWLLVVLEDVRRPIAVAVCDLAAAEALIRSLILAMPQFRAAA